VRGAAAGFTVAFQTARFDGKWHNDQARVDLIARCYALNPEPLNFPKLPFDFGPEL
jgi:exonuclease I